MKNYIKGIISKRAVSILLFAVVFLMFQSTNITAAVYTEGYYYYEIKEDAVVITGYFGAEKKIILPDKIAGYPVSEIAEGAFANTKAEVIYLPDTIMTIGENAFPLAAEVQYSSENQTDSFKEDLDKKDNTNRSGKKENGNKDLNVGNSEDGGRNDVVMGIEEVEINGSSLKEKSSDVLPSGADADQTAEVNPDHKAEDEAESDEESEEGSQAERKDVKKAEKKDGSVTGMAAFAVVLLAAVFIIGKKIKLPIKLPYGYNVKGKEDKKDDI